MQYPIGAEEDFVGVIDLIEMQAHYFEGDAGEQWLKREIPDELRAEVEAARDRLLDQISILSDTMMEELLDDEPVPPQQIWDTLRQGTLNLKFTPVLLGSALKNKGVQPLLEAIARYLPSPRDRSAVTATDVETHQSIPILPKADDPLVALAFKLIENEYGQFTYARLYAGTLKQGDRLHNSRTQQRVRVNRLIRIEVDKRQEVDSAVAGDIVGLIGPDCASGDTLCSPHRRVSLEGMVIPEPVMTLALTPDSPDDIERLEKALHRFVKEDPTLQVRTGPESHKLLLSGMGELHLNIYLERIWREYRAQVHVGAPAVAYRETLTQAAPFDYTLDQPAGPTEQYAQVSGHIEPCEKPFQFESQLPQEALPPPFLEACEQGFRDAIQTGWLKGYPIVGVKVVLEKAMQHPHASTPATCRFAGRQSERLLVLTHATSTCVNTSNLSLCRPARV